ncbi:hypothetical protein [Adhaeribacter pallidiroseus]|uniref:Uncharacterized protein n=1 Tax=Adhaeribacter pallidiroseus TaxID=2072847 RepID=A0A369QB47_9BACT|nr:hypothetical protein [Adhaeribacter pallidiroseus]RDC62141.1 hypothetical protein AHMF7616_00732 [Adhaeribacter pallidiroseus]
MRIVLLMTLATWVAGGCQINQKSMTPNSTLAAPLDFSAGPPTIIYKTKQDYTNQVAVILTPDKTSIAAYPHPQDIANKGNQVKPTLLANGYLLDNQGINPNVAFTSYTFAQYAALPQAPSLEELKNSIINADPLAYICNCGNRNQYGDIAASMNNLIAQKLAPCKTLK